MVKSLPLVSIGVLEKDGATNARRSREGQTLPLVGLKVHHQHCKL